MTKFDKAIKTTSEKLYGINNPDADIQAYEDFFSLFNVSLKDEEGNYKTVYDVFKEASENLKSYEHIYDFKR